MGEETACFIAKAARKINNNIMVASPCEHQRKENLKRQMGNFTDKELAEQRRVNRLAGLGDFVDTQLIVYDRQRRAHAAAGLGLVTTSDLIKQAVAAAEQAFAEKQHVAGEIDAKLRKAWFEHWGPIFIHGALDEFPPSFPPGPLPIAPPPSEEEISAVQACMIRTCSKRFSVFTWRHSCGVCRATTCDDCVATYGNQGLEGTPRICQRCRARCEEWNELHYNSSCDWSNQRARAQVDAANAARKTSGIAQEELMAAEAAERPRKDAATAQRRAKEQAEHARLRAEVNACEAAERAARLKRQELRDRKAAEERTKAKADRLKTEVNAIVTAASTVAEAILRGPFLLEFQVPEALEHEVDAANKCKTKLQDCNDAIREAYSQTAVQRASKKSTASAPTDDATTDPLLMARNQARAQYVISAAALISASTAMCGQRRQHAESAQLLFAQVDQTLEKVIQRSQHMGLGSRPVWQPAERVIKDIRDAVEHHKATAAESPGAASQHVVDSHEVQISQELAESLPPLVYVVAEAVRWGREAAQVAKTRHDAIKQAAAQNQALLDIIEPWLAPAAAKKLLASAKDAHTSKKRAHKVLKTAQFALDTVDSEDDSAADSEGGPSLEVVLAAAKEVYAKAVRADVQAQGKIAEVIRDHLPELAALAAPLNNGKTASPPPPPPSDAPTCCICLDEPANHTCVPCGHKCYCPSCAETMARQNCAICRAPVTDVIRVYE